MTGDDDPRPASDPAVNLAGEMRWNLGPGQTAILKYSEGATVMVLDIILVPSGERSRGIGSELIRRFLVLADALGKEVHTTARPIGQASSEIVARLVRYYERFGFVAVRPGIRSVEMTRPRTPLRP